MEGVNKLELDITVFRKNRLQLFSHLRKANFLLMLVNKGDYKKGTLRFYQ